MKVLGLTGGVGMGKSACAKLLQERSIPVVDTDELARLVVQPGQPALSEIQASFGAQMIAPDGTLRRGELARQVFSDRAAREKLEHILHPRIRQLWRSQVESWRAEGHALVTVVIPLLFETGAEKELDQTICVACSGSTQHARLAARGWSAEQIVQRIHAQWSVEQKLAKSDFVIWTEGNMELHSIQLDRILHSVSLP
jgi:dephospho-CoA kinase